MHTYYIDYPRDLANEYTVYVVTPDIAADFAKAFPSADRCTRKSAIERGWSRPKEARATGEQWYGGFCDDCSSNGWTLADALVAAAKSTAWAVQDRLARMVDAELV